MDIEVFLVYYHKTDSAHNFRLKVNNFPDIPQRGCAVFLKGNTYFVERERYLMREGQDGSKAIVTGIELILEDTKNEWPAPPSDSQK